MSKFQQISAQSFQFYKSLQHYISNRIQVDESSQYHIICLQEKLNIVTKDFGSLQGINACFEIPQLNDLFCYIIQQNVKQLRLFSDELIQSLQHDALKLSTFQSLRNVDESLAFHRQQISKFFSSDKDPIQWQIETNLVEASAQLEQLNLLYDLRDQMLSEIKQYSIDNSCSYLTCYRLVETLQCEKRFLVNQLITLKDMQCENNTTLDALIIKIEIFIDSIEKNSVIHWIIQYSQTCERVIKINQDTNQLFKKLQKQLDALSEKHHSEGTTSEDYPNDLSHSKQSITSQNPLRKKPQLLIYKCQQSEQDSSNSYKKTIQHSHQPIINDENKSPSLSYYDKDKAQSVEVLESHEVEPKRVYNRNNDLIEDRTENNCLSCQIF